MLDYASVQGLREGPNPARWRGHLDKLLPRRAKVQVVRQHAAMPWQDLPNFLIALRLREAIAARALETAILTAARSGEGFGMRWSEVDLAAAVWVVPASRMKAGREHRVPLSTPVLEVLRGMLLLRRADDLVFPGQCEGRPWSVMSMVMLMRRMGHGDLTIHGFRSTFRDWAGETTAHPRDVIEERAVRRAFEFALAAALDRFGRETLADAARGDAA